MAYHYESDFHDLATRMNLASAEVIVPLVRDLIPVSSVVDFGCAQGGWLAVWSQNGVSEILGMDGAYVDQTRLLIDGKYFQTTDLNRRVDLDRRFDLAMSVEVAEHLPAENAATFVESLTRHAPIVLFSAAPPGQGGEYHVNEQPYSYWRDLFRAQGYLLYDAIRPMLQGNTSVQPWYRYNLLLFVEEGATASLPESVRARHIPNDAPVPDVAPLSYRARRQIVRFMPQGLQRIISHTMAHLRRA